MAHTIPATSIAPVKRISTPEQLDKYLESPTCAKQLNFIENLNESVVGLASDTECKVVTSILKMFDKVSVWVDEIPPVEQPMRFGNKAFRTWVEKIEANLEELMKEILPEQHWSFALEVGTYWANSLGNKTRIDFGTGHETAFIAFIFCLYQLGVATPEDNVAFVLKVFNSYLQLMRKVQRVYLLEPAGSHGVWSLDDHYFLVFYFGSAQLRGHAYIKPKSVKNKDIIESYADKYMYLDAIKHILSTKTGPFAEHSPILESICNVIHWEKVNGGMMKMYKGEVLAKFPVMQHFLFGSLIPFPE